MGHLQTSKLFRGNPSLVRALHLCFVNLQGLAVFIRLVAGNCKIIIKMSMKQLQKGGNNNVNALSLGVCSRLDNQVVRNTYAREGGRQKMGRSGRLRELQEEHSNPGSFLELYRDWVKLLV